MRYLLIFWFLLMSPAVKSANIFVDGLQVSDVVSSLGLPHFQYQTNFVWFTSLTSIICKVEIEKVDKCYLGKSIEQIEKEFNITNWEHNEINGIKKFIDKNSQNN